MKTSIPARGRPARSSWFCHSVLFGVLVVPLQPVFAQSPAPAATSLQADAATVVVTATRARSRIDDALTEVTVIDRAQIERASGQTLAQLLAQQPGVQFTSSGGFGSSQSIFLRGLETRHTLLLIDGVRYGSATVGTPIWENLPLGSIERIEIVRGPLSALYGTDAVAGVVQIFTRRGTPGVATDAAATVGSRGFEQLSGGVRFGEGNIDGAVHLQQTRTTGISSTNSSAPFGNFNGDNDGFRQQGGSAQLGWQFVPGWRADARVLRARARTAYDDGPGVDSKAALTTEVSSLTVAGSVSGNWRTSLRMARSKDEYDTLTSASPFAALGVIGTVQQQVTWENNIDTPLGVLMLLTEQLKQTVTRPGDAFVVSDRSIQALAAGLNGRAGPHGWQLNLRHDRNSQFGGQSTGSLGYGFDLSRAWRAAASYGTSFVAPSFNQLYFPAFGNPNLLPEEGKHGEVSLRWAGAGQQLRMAYFDNRIRGYISSGPLPTNIPRTRVDGVSISYEARVNNWTLAASSERINPRNDTEGSVNYGRWLPRRSKEMLRLAADLDLGAWKFGGQLAAFGPRFDDSANTTRLGGFATMDLRGEYRLNRQWAAGLRLNNLADKVYQTVNGYNQPRRELFLTVRYTGG